MKVVTAAVLDESMGVRVDQGACVVSCVEAGYLRFAGFDCREVAVFLVYFSVASSCIPAGRLQDAVPAVLSSSSHLSPAIRLPVP